MSTLNELIRYCTEKHHWGALLLTGEWGCGKTYLIEKRLTVALAQPHSVSWVISFAFVGLEVFTSIAAFFLLFFLNVEKTIGKEQAEIKARHGATENDGELPAEP